MISAPFLQSDIEEMADLLFLPDAVERRIAMFAAYFDDSGTHSESSVVSIAGYIAGATDWKHFAAEWNQLLSGENITHFHMTDFESRHGEFIGWDDQRRIRVIKRAIEIIHRRTIKGFSCSVNKDDFDDLIPEFIPGSAYVLCLVDCMTKCDHWAKEGNRQEPIACFLEQGGGYVSEINRIRQVFLETDSSHIHSLTLAKKTAHPQLQPADILAYESYKYWINKEIKDNNRPIRKSFQLLLRKIDFGHYLNRNDLIELIKMTYGDRVSIVDGRIVLSPTGD